MKNKLAAVLITLVPLIFTACSSSDTTTVRINLGLNKEALYQPSMIDKILNLFSTKAYAYPGGVNTIHVAVFDGSVSTDNLVMKKSIAAADSVEMEVPSGNNRIFVIVTTGLASAAATYSGETDPINLSGQETVDIAISMKTIALNGSYNTDTFSASWDKVPGAEKYTLEVGCNIQETFDVSGTFFSWPNNDTFYVNAEFPFFGLSSSSQFFGLGC